MIEEFAGLIPGSLWGGFGEGVLFGAGCFLGAADLYIIGLNPGGSPGEYPTETVGAHTRKVVDESPNNWCAFTDEGWDVPPLPPGQHQMQKNVLHLLEGLGLDCRKIPASNLVFARSSDADKIRAEIPALADACWTFHRAVIRRLGVRVVLCQGQYAGGGVMARLEADDPGAGRFSEVDRFAEDNRRKWVSKVYQNGGGVAVVQLTHPSRCNWINPKSDPSELVRRALGDG